ncbi:hypothetical protein VCB98_03775 [Gammaproteobacteria bacterium AB-CW1]|uniref:Uncharacterized protein n=1 Tax=Natronospira elongata TaxID=3110268 RepID=A0AAP6JF16_9GAMM|nr:hypothetical protein [Gammaproteobacteria bacterium AB-CW1]
MRASWILIVLAIATLVFVLLQRPGVDSDTGRDLAPAQEPDRAVAEREPAPPREAAREGRQPEPREEREIAETELETQDESDRPQGGYDSRGREFYESEDYHAFVEDALQDAADGDPSAQYYLYRALSECELAVSQFDGEFPDEFELAAALPATMAPGVNELMMQQVERCRGFFEQEPAQYGSARGWLEEAAAQDYGPAVMHQGVRQYRHWMAGRDSGFEPDRIVDTLRDRNPESLSYASQLSAVNNSPQADESAWLMLACKYGQDCSGDADWVRALCLQQGCPPDFDGAEDALSMLLSPGEMDQARDRMQELEEALDRGDFESLFP